MRTHRAAAVAGTAILLASGTAGTAAAEPTPPPPPKPRISDAAVATAVSRLDATVEDVMRRTKIPGVAVAVVHRDKVLYLKGFGLRRTGESAKVDPDTVFQLASVSKPVSSTVVAGALRDPAAWDKPLGSSLPGFALADPWVTSHVTPADLFSHRTGLPDHAGDLLEDLGYDQSYILGHLREEPLTPFRSSYAYTNFGLTAAAEAVARDHGTTWQKLSADTLFKPAGMTHTSTEFSAFANAADRAYGHVKNPDGTWSPRFVRDADAQAPAGGASSTARDMARWLRLQLGDGVLDGKRIIPADSLGRTRLPEIVSQAQTFRGVPQFYGLGWNVSYDDAGRLRLGHSGGFELGANTNVTLLPLEQLGIVVLTNAAPVGQADAIALDFFDTAEHGKPTADWLALTGALYAQELNEGHRSTTDYAHPPAGARPAREAGAYTGTYDNPFYGPLTVTADAKGALTLSLGPKPQRFPLTHYDGDTFSFVTTGENAIGRTGVTFSDGKVRIEYLDAEHLGTFTRK
ncbi:CubicO group peptidase (beta-lactamase class C family) [Streptomyces sp. 3211.6]|uniref:serine hydrolase n=1 Tax=Streptomyces TaxID=1883 RepID=UPI0009A50130|nr:MULTISPECIES: serine hydrolase [Streptomyces]RKT03788.1 CubicO group peptidase (beta-lactamase class C family) [Streptomyces sp. 3211.6]RPF39658.1 CubicO group peptidase (beta-lactamase class C family) [Streptomyces sp. Ag109_G2-6]